MSKASLLRKGLEIGVGLTAITALFLAGCGGGSSSSAGGAGVSSSSLVITPSLGQIYQGQIQVTGANGTSRNYSIVSGVPSITADISGMTAPLLIELRGDPTNGNKLVFFDEALGGISSSVANSSSSVRAIVPSVSGLSASGVGVTALTEVAAATVANASGVVNISGLSVASAVGANTAGLALAQKINGGGTTITDVLAPPLPVSAPGTALGTSEAHEYAKVLHTLASLPPSYGNNAMEKAIQMRASIQSNGGALPPNFNADIATAFNNVQASAFKFSGAQSAPVASINGNFASMADIAARALPASAIAASANAALAQRAAMNAMMQEVFNAASNVAAPPTTAAILAAVSAAQAKADTAAQVMLANPPKAGDPPAILLAALQNSIGFALQGMPPASAVPFALQGMPPASAVTFATAGISAASAVQYTNNGILPASAVQYAVAGYSPASAVQFVASGIPATNVISTLSAQCTQAGGTWNANNNTCIPPSVGTPASGTTGAGTGLNFSPAIGANALATMAGSSTLLQGPATVLSGISMTSMSWGTTNNLNAGSVPLVSISHQSSATFERISLTIAVLETATASYSIASSYCLISGTFPNIGTCSSQGISFNRAAGTVTFSSTPFYKMTNGLAATSSFTASGSLGFTPF